MERKRVLKKMESLRKFFKEHDRFCGALVKSLDKEDTKLQCTEFIALDLPVDGKKYRSETHVWEIRYDENDEVIEAVCDDGTEFTIESKTIPESFIEKNFECLLDGRINELTEIMNRVDETDEGVFIDTEKMFGKPYSLEDHMILANLMVGKAGFERAKALENGVLVF